MRLFFTIAMAFVAIPAILAGLSSLFAINDQIGAARAKKAAEMARANNINSGKGFRGMYRRMKGRGLTYKYARNGGSVRRRKGHRRGKGMLGDMLGNLPLIGPLIRGIGLGRMTKMQKMQLQRIVKGRGLTYKYHPYKLKGGMLRPAGGLLRPAGCGMKRHRVKGHYRHVKVGRAGRGMRRTKRVHVRGHLSH
jgi:hypothetical protein